MDKELPVENNEEIREEENTAEPTLRETLAAEFAKRNEAQESTEAEKLGRSRDASGKFTKAAPAEGVISTEQNLSQRQSEPNKISPDQADQQTNAQQQAAQSANSAPQSWSAEARNAWVNIPPEAQKYIAQREAETHKALTANGEERQFARSMQQALQPHLDTLRETGNSPAAAVNGLLNVDRVLRKGTAEQKVQMVHEILRSYQIPLESVNTQQAIRPDPNVLSLQQQMQAMQQQFYQTQQQQQLAVQEQQAQTEIAAFKANAPHFEAVREEMGLLLDKGVATSLQDAYDRAVWARPDLRSQLMAQQNAASQQQQRVNKAKVAGSSISGAPDGVKLVPQSSSRSLREELEAQLKAANSRV